jgi:glycosyltransferase involved in cell wall biosynthesis
LFDKSISEADFVIAVSQSTANDIKLDLSAKNLSVIYNGVSSRYLNFRDSSGEENRIRNKYGLGKDYIFSPGTIEPRKNFHSLLKAFDLFVEKYDAKDKMQLVITGAKGWGQRSLDKTICSIKNKDSIKILGYVDENDMPGLYACSKAYITASLYEGFGLPLLEAMATGTPILCSSIPAYNEVCQNGCLNFNPLGIDSIAEAIHEVLTNSCLMDKIVKTNRQRVSSFSWMSSAEKTLAIFEKRNNIQNSLES